MSTTANLSLQGDRAASAPAPRMRSRVDGRRVRLPFVTPSEAWPKASAWVVLPSRLGGAASDWDACPEGVCIRVEDQTAGEMDSLVHRGSCDKTDLVVSHSDAVVEVVSSPSARGDSDRERNDDVAPSPIRRGLVFHGDEDPIVYRRPLSSEGEIAARVVGCGDVPDLPQPGLSAAVEALFDG